MPPLRWIVVALAVLQGGRLAFDGTRALVGIDRPRRRRPTKRVERRCSLSYIRGRADSLPEPAHRLPGKLAGICVPNQPFGCNAGRARCEPEICRWNARGTGRRPRRPRRQLRRARQSGRSVGGIRPFRPVSLAHFACSFVLAADDDWEGRLCFDRPRHRLHMHLPVNYPRLNEFPEWFTVEPDSRYRVQAGSAAEITVSGQELAAGLPLRLKASDVVVVRVESPP